MMIDSFSDMPPVSSNPDLPTAAEKAWWKVNSTSPTDHSFVSNSPAYAPTFPSYAAAFEKLANFQRDDVSANMMVPPAPPENLDWPTPGSKMPFFQNVISMDNQPPPPMDNQPPPPIYMDIPMNKLDPYSQLEEEQLADRQLQDVSLAARQLQDEQYAIRRVKDAQLAALKLKDEQLTDRQLKLEALQLEALQLEALQLQYEHDATRRLKDEELDARQFKDVQRAACQSERDRLAACHLEERQIAARQLEARPIPANPARQREQRPGCESVVLCGLFTYREVGFESLAWECGMLIQRCEQDERQEKRQKKRQRSHYEGFHPGPWPTDAPW
jgi:hypothetical protein